MDGDDAVFPSEYSRIDEIGLMKRELFAAMAMVGLLAKEGMSCDCISEVAVERADGLIAQLNKEKCGDDASQTL
jgi:hypothetical protein